MADKQAIEAQIRETIATVSGAIPLSEKLFSPTGLFSHLASTEEERRVLVKSPLFKEAQRRFRELQLAEADAFFKNAPQPPDGCIVQIQKTIR